MGILIEELSALYQAFSRGSATPLPELAIQYGDFTVWQRQWLTEELQQRQIDYWKEQLADAPRLLELPTDYLRPSIQTFSGAVNSLKINSDLTAKIKESSQQLETNFFVMLLAAFAVLLHRYSGQDDICISSPFANRNRTEIKPLIRLFVNTLVLRSKIKENPNFSELVAQIQQVFLNAYAHQDVPFDQVVEAVQPERSLSYNPLYQVMFVLENFALDALELPGITLTPELVHRGTAQCDLSLSLWETKTGLLASWEYNTDLFDEATITRMAGHYQTLLEGIVANPKQKISELQLLTPIERHQLLVEWNNTWAEYPQDRCIHQLFEEQVERAPDAVAVVFEGKHLTYQELNAKANQLAHYLRSLDVGPEVLVGICVERSFEMIVGILGALKAGGAYVPIDPAYPQERLAFMLEDSSVPVLLTQEKLAEKLPQHSVRIVCLDSDIEKIASHSDSTPSSTVSPQNLAYVIYTSGSTGKPKGVTVPHRAVNRLVINTNYINFQPIDVVAFASNFSFDAATFEIWGALLNGAKLAIISPHIALSPYEFAAQIEKQNVTVLFLTTALFNSLTREVPRALQSVRHLLFGGEAVEPKWVKKILQEGSPERLLHVYGRTENTTFTTWYLVQNVPEEARTLPIGSPIANTQVYLLDTQMQLVPIGVAGELYIGGEGLAQGYLNRPDLTDEKFIPNPFTDFPGSRLYKTGDLARYLPDGNIEYLGRLDNQVKVRGFRIELGEVEAALAQHPYVGTAAVTVREDIPGSKRLVAYVVPDEKRADTSSLRSFLKAKLPDYMIPAVFVMLDALPLTPNGKVDRRALPAPDISSLNPSESFVPPQTATEKVLATIWAEVLQISPVSVRDNFFSLGGDSILSLQIVARCHQAGLKLTPKDLFQHQTIAELARAVGQTVEIQAEQSLVTGAVPLTPIGHWFLEQKLSEPNHLNQSFLFEVSPGLKPELLQQVVRQLLLHHDALRLRLIPDSDTKQLFNAETEETELFSLVDLSALATAEKTAAIEATAAQLQRSLSLSEGPLLRVALFNLGPDQASRLLIVIHHIAVDGVSWRILLEDLATAYQQLDRGEPINLPAKTTSFKDWAVRLADYARSQAAAAELDYWLAQSDSEIVPIPVDYPEGKLANTIADSAEVSVSLSVEQTSALLKEVPSAYNTQINDVLLTALVQSFAEWTGQTSLLIDLEGHGREELFEDVSTSRTVGWFTSIYPVVLKLEDSVSPGEALKSVKEQLRRIPQRGIGYGILRYLNPDEATRLKLQALPTAEVSFNYLGQFDQMLSAFPLLGLAKESSGADISPLMRRSHLLEVNGLVAEGKLQLTWTYSLKLHQRSTVERLAESFLKALSALISHCLSPDAFGYTPSDFPLAALEQEELDEIMEFLNLEQ